MLDIKEKRVAPHGELWFTKVDRKKWRWLFMFLPYFVMHDDLGMLPPEPSMQTESDLDLKTLPQYACKVPSVFFYPYTTYIVEDRLGQGFGPYFVIPKTPLNRLEARYWLDSLAAHQFQLINPSRDKARYRHGWIDTDDTAYSEGGWPMEYLELKRMATAVKSFLLDDIRYVYNESEHSSDSHKTSTPKRHQFNSSVVDFGVTTAYLEWYVEQFNALFEELLAIGQNSDQAGREKCLVTGWTINRLAVDTIAISITDAPYIRRWQFFGMLDAIAGLKNEFEGTSHYNDAQTAKEMLDLAFFRQTIEPLLSRIPIPAVRDELLTHTRIQYHAIDEMQTDGCTGPELVRLYRNSRHGYTLRNSNDRRQLLEHCGSIPNDMPDLAIALWHYVLLKFPEL